MEIVEDQAKTLEEKQAEAMEAFKTSMRQVRVSQEVYEAICAIAIPLTDTPDSVLRRVFNLPAREFYRKKIHKKS